jgi:cytochrome c peroxidase
MSRRASFGAAAVIWGAVLAAAIGSGGRLARADSGSRPMFVFENAAGLMGTFSLAGNIDLQNPFFQDLGTNGRRCVTCHQPGNAWTITPQNVQQRFLASHGSDPIFSNNDGSNCEGDSARTLEEKKAAYSLLLTRGLIRVGLNLRDQAEFIIDSVRDPNHCGPASNDASLYRRPLPSANLRFLSAVMWDGRESSPTTSIAQDLRQQANDATRGHAAAARDLTDQEAQQIVDFETGLFAAQTRDPIAGGLDNGGATGGPLALSKQPFFMGVNDPVGLNPTGAAFDSRAFTIFNPWMAFQGDDAMSAARRSIARGQEVFNTKPIVLTGVGGLNHQRFSSGVVVPDPFVGTCTTCHDTPNAGNHSVKAPLNIGLSDPAIAPYLPIYTLRNIATGETVETTDPGLAMISGKWADIGRFKGPILRALSARAPYFHNGSAATFDEVLNFYENRFHIGLTAQERADLIAFLKSL